MSISIPRRMRLLAFVAGAAATIQSVAHGQSAAINGEITGTVTDPSGAAIAGAVIQISNAATGFKRETKVYRVRTVPLHLAAAGYLRPPGSGGGIRGCPPCRGDGECWRYDHGHRFLQIAGASTAIDVSATTALTDPSRTDLGSTLDSDATQNLPLVSRNPYNFMPSIW